MKRLAFAPVLLILSSASMAEPVVQTAAGDWTRLPQLSQRGYDHLDINVMSRLYRIASERKCALPGYSHTGLDLNLSFAVQYNPDGSLGRIILPKLDCPEAEGLLGYAIIKMINAGDYKATGENPEGWYQSELTFNYEH
jgi:hypothetical protein